MNDSVNAQFFLHGVVAPCDNTTNLLLLAGGVWQKTGATTES